MTAAVSPSEANFDNLLMACLQAAEMRLHWALKCDVGMS